MAHTYLKENQLAPSPRKMCLNFIKENRGYQHTFHIVCKVNTQSIWMTQLKTMQQAAFGEILGW
jgi:hypothetical protein